MLRLPDDWSSSTHEWSARHLFAQIGSPADQTDFARTMIEESLEMMVTRIALRSDRWIPIEVKGPLEWRINNGIFTYCPVVDNRTLNVCVELGKISSMLYIVVPEGIEIPMKKCLDFILRRRSPMVETLPGFVGLRLLFHQLDLERGHPEVLAHLLREYNKSIERTPAADSLAVDLPDMHSAE